LKRIIKAISEKDPDVMCKNAAFMETGNMFLGEILKGQDLNDLGVKVWPSHYLIPQHFRAKHRYNGPDTVYAEQMWGSTKGLYKEA